MLGEVPESHLTGHPVLRTVCGACRNHKQEGEGGTGEGCQPGLSPVAAPSITLPTLMGPSSNTLSLIVPQWPVHQPETLIPASVPRLTYRYRGCSEVSEGERSGMERDVDDRVVAMEAVVASSKEGGVQGRRSGRPREGGGGL